MESSESRANRTTVRQARLAGGIANPFRDWQFSADFFAHRADGTISFPALGPPAGALGDPCAAEGGTHSWSEFLRGRRMQPVSLRAPDGGGGRGTRGEFGVNGADELRRGGVI